MPNYIVYRLNEAGGIRGAEWISASNDADALLLARAMLPGVDCEVWQRNRRIGRVDFLARPIASTGRPARARNAR